MAYGDQHLYSGANPCWCGVPHGNWGGTWTWPSTTYTFNPEFSDNGYVGLHRR